MYINAHNKGLLTVGGRDKRITTVGYYLRKFKLDELPQLINVIKGDMSIVGPRPELRHYVNYYSVEQMRVLNVVPGITDYASIKYRNENELLAKAKHPEEFYIRHIMPEKIRLNTVFINNPSLKAYFTIIWYTFIGIFK
jgi:lipopolysaccharide/colanic/teichoic acid biosynthesis glycosyltransferase